MTALQAKDIDVRKYGARTDGKTFATSKIQKAIDDVSASGGGRVILSGGTFLSATLQLKNGVELFLDADATLLASPDPEDFKENADFKHCDSYWMPRRRNAAFIYANEAENIAISGRGKIDGNGQYAAHEKADTNCISR